jgi:group II intron reverse transcriptase/maturase
VRGVGSEELLEGKMAGTSRPETISTRLQEVAKLARQAPGLVLTTLAHHIDIELLREAYRRTRKDAAVGVDGQTADQYAADLETNLQSLLGRLKTGTYWAPPVRRVHIPKGVGKTRPIGIPTFEDKVLQRAVVMVLEAVYEQDFLPYSYAFRPGRSAHQALQDLWEGTMKRGGGWVLEADIQSFFDTLDHGHLRSFLDQRVRDGVLRRVIGKWLQAGVLENGWVSHPETGTPQGGVISPLLANIYLHEVLDKWFEMTKPLLEGEAFLVRYADDFVIVFSKESDARRVLAALPKRFGEYGLTLHPEKTRLVKFQRPKQRPRGLPEARGRGPKSFDLLGFTHFWARSRRGSWIVKRKTAQDRLRKALRRIADWCRGQRHLPLPEQQRILGMKLRGHYAYYGITGNAVCLRNFLHQVRRIWRYWLSRRSHHSRLSWTAFQRLVAKYSLPPSVVVHSVYRQAARP